MFRTVIVNSGERVQIKDNWLTITVGEEARRIPVEDVYSLVLDNRQALISSSVITALAASGAHILICDDKHMPAACVYPFNQHYRPLNVVRKQIGLPQEVKDALWAKIIRAKLENQARALEFAGVSGERVKRLRQLAAEVQDADEGNREGIGAKWYFRSLFGTDFLRTHDSGINSALNYGYAVIRSAVGKTLCAYGFNCVLGIHHIGEGNPFNLADDLMEPLRPLADLWTDRYHEELLDALTREQRAGLIDLINQRISHDGKKMRVRNAVDRYVAAFSAAVSRCDPSALKIPILLKPDLMDGGEEDDEPLYEGDGDV